MRCHVVISDICSSGQAAPTTSIRAGGDRLRSEERRDLRARAHRSAHRRIADQDLDTPLHRFSHAARRCTAASCSTRYSSRYAATAGTSKRLSGDLRRRIERAAKRNASCLYLGPSRCGPTVPRHPKIGGTMPAATRMERANGVRPHTVQRRLPQLPWKRPARLPRATADESRGPAPLPSCSVPPIFRVVWTPIP